VEELFENYLAEKEERRLAASASSHSFSSSTSPSEQEREEPLNQGEEKASNQADVSASSKMIKKDEEQVLTKKRRNPVRRFLSMLKNLFFSDDYGGVEERETIASSREDSDESALVSTENSHSGSLSQSQSSSMASAEEAQELTAEENMLSPQPHVILPYDTSSPGRHEEKASVVPSPSPPSPPLSSASQQGLEDSLVRSQIEAMVESELAQEDVLEEAKARKLFNTARAEVTLSDRIEGSEVVDTKGQDLVVPAIEYHLSFQSRVGPVKWLQPYTEEKIAELAEERSVFISINTHQ
jgi:hypothetical protein